MKIKKVLNNNAVIAINDKREEVVITGLGLAFQKKSGDNLDQNKIERIFRMESKEISRKFRDLIHEIPIEYVEATDEIITCAKDNLNVSLNENIHITLTDHISFAIERIRNHINITNPMVWEIKRFYMDEYTVGMKAIDIIEERLGVRLPQDEAASIAMHIVNAELNEEMPRVMNMIKIIQDSLNIIKYHFGIELEEDSLHYQRLVTHLKFFAQRIITYHDKHAVQAKDHLFDIIHKQYPEAYKCAAKIEKYAREKYNFVLSQSEMTYLIVHIERVVQA
ncbi:PRD domain-containing protein [Vallitalea pronyensis]|uniref:PRD domain-containing protein n=1 Tax=Vallitalea pronyensis TaxID=1348613 RepID=A0A8J8MLL6_9FIRM|nr:PRD domain-containing protein [Vallitalea pronyensis]QUI23513.1 PRD domain-containing protein [Vallitalea pronyensis]